MRILIWASSSDPRSLMSCVDESAMPRVLNVMRCQKHEQYTGFLWCHFGGLIEKYLRQEQRNLSELTTQNFPPFSLCIFMKGYRD